jgi:hypothetical protein
MCKKEWRMRYVTCVSKLKQNSAGVTDNPRSFTGNKFRGISEIVKLMFSTHATPKINNNRSRSKNSCFLHISGSTVEVLLTAE